MKAVIQRVSFASVTIGEKEVSKIGKGLLILLGIDNEDVSEDIEWLCRKKIGTGEFGAMMDVSLVNDGPVTIIIDTKNKD